MKTIVVAVLLALVAGCSSSSKPTGPGALSVALLSAPASSGANASLAAAPEDVTSVVVSVTKVRAHVASGGWIVLSDAPVEVDLLALPDAGEALGFARLPAGKVTQLRLLVAETGNYVQTTSGQRPLVVPSGLESGIKIHGPWDISPCNETAVALEFDGKKSVWYHATGGGTWMLRPVIHVKRARFGPTSCEEGGFPQCVPAECASGECDESGKCAPGGAGDACAVGTECLSGVCTEALVCDRGGAGDPCRDAFDCASDVCTEDGTCGAGTAGGAGSECTTNLQCLSKNCQAPVCAPGEYGTSCARDPDCAPELFCREGACL